MQYIFFREVLVNFLEVLRFPDVRCLYPCYGIDGPMTRNIECTASAHVCTCCTNPTMHQSYFPHNIPFCSRNVHSCAHFCYKMVHCETCFGCIMGFVRRVYGCYPDWHSRPVMWHHQRRGIKFPRKDSVPSRSLTNQEGISKTRIKSMRC